METLRETPGGTVPGVQANPQVQQPVPAGTSEASETSETERRLLDGLTAAITEKGYRDVTVADIVRNARTSRRTFYECFTSRDDCFVALLLRRNIQLAERIAAAVDPAVPWRTQVRQAIEEWIAAATEEPAITLCWARDAPALGEVARALQRRIQQAFVQLVENLAAGPRPPGDDLRPLTSGRAVVLVAGLRELVANQVEDGGDLAEIVETAVSATIALLRAD